MWGCCLQLPLQFFHRLSSHDLFLVVWSMVAAGLSSLIISGECWTSVGMRAICRSGKGSNIQRKRPRGWWLRQLSTTHWRGTVWKRWIFNFLWKQSFIKPSGWMSVTLPLLRCNIKKALRNLSLWEEICCYQFRINYILTNKSIERNTIKTPHENNCWEGTLINNKLLEHRCLIRYTNTRLANF